MTTERFPLSKIAGQRDRRAACMERYIRGYASLFEVADLGGDILQRGAFARSLAVKGSTGIRMLFQHDPAQPIGTWTSIREDGRGLLVEGRLADRVGRAREVFDLIRDGALDGLSIGFRTVKAIRGGNGKRRILEADLWEISVVTFPMLPGARVSEARMTSPAGRQTDARDMVRIITNATRLIEGKEIRA